MKTGETQRVGPRTMSTLPAQRVLARAISLPRHQLLGHHELGDGCLSSAPKAREEDAPPRSPLSGAAQGRGGLHYGALVLVVALASVEDPHSAAQPAVVDLRVQLPRSPGLQLAFGATTAAIAAMMPLQIERTAALSGLASPLIVLQFPGFRLSLLSDQQRTQLRALSGRALRHLAVVATVCGFYAFGLRLIALCSAVFVHAAVFALVTFSTFMSCAMLAMDANKNARLARKRAKHASLHSQQSSRRRSRLPSLTPTGDPAVVSKRQRMGYAFFDGVEDLGVVKGRRFERSESSDSTCSESSTSSSMSASSMPESPSSLPLIGRRVADQLKQPNPSMNVVYGDRRRRSKASLADAKIRVGKAHTQQMPGAKKPQDIYVVRVDCTSPEQPSPSSKKQEKHMNPTVMWDITATFGEFQRLERELKKEVKAKNIEAAKVPHLSSGAVLFVQRELDEHVLHARRQKIQAFIDAVRSNSALASTDAMRKFCQAY